MNIKIPHLFIRLCKKKKILTLRSFSLDWKLYTGNPLQNKNTIQLFYWQLDDKRNQASYPCCHISDSTHPCFTFLSVHYSVRYEGWALFPPWALFDEVTLFQQTGEMRFGAIIFLLCSFFLTSASCVSVHYDVIRPK